MLRGLFIGGGLVLIEKFHALVVLFGGFLVYSSYKLLAPGEDGDEDEDLSNNAVVKWASSTFNATSEFDGGRLFTRRGMSDAPAEGGGLLAALGRPTPLLLVLVCIELSDILFAVDSIPAVFGVTDDPFIAFTSNIFAIIGLRSLYSVLASAVQDLVRALAAPKAPPLSAPFRAGTLSFSWLLAGVGVALRFWAMLLTDGLRAALQDSGSHRRPSRPRALPFGRQAYLEQSVAVVLGFVGVKLLAQGAGFELDTMLSLGIVSAVLGVGIGMSIYENQSTLAEAADGAGGSDGR